MSVKLTALISVAVLSTGVVGTAGTYGATLTTIGNYLGNDLLDSDDSDDWKVLQQKLNSSEDKDIEGYMDASLQSARQSKQTPENGNQIKAWCEKQKPHKVNPYFNLFESGNLLKAAETFCIRTIGDKLGEN